MFFFNFWVFILLSHTKDGSEDVAAPVVDQEEEERRQKGKAKGRSCERIPKA